MSNEQTKTDSISHEEDENERMWHVYQAVYKALPEENMLITTKTLCFILAQYARKTDIQEFCKFVTEEITAYSNGIIMAEAIENAEQL